MPVWNEIEQRCLNFLKEEFLEKGSAPRCHDSPRTTHEAVQSHLGVEQRKYREIMARLEHHGLVDPLMIDVVNGHLEISPSIVEEVAELDQEKNMPKEEITEIRVFISHSSEDAELAKHLINLLRSALRLAPKDIRCTSVDGYRLPGGALTEEQLIIEVHGADAFIGLITPSSIGSAYVLLELGARWGAGKHLLPLLAAGASPSSLGPLQNRNALRLTENGQVHQMLKDLAEHLDLSVSSPESFLDLVEAITTCAKNNARAKPENSQASDSRLRDTSPALSKVERDILFHAEGKGNGDVFIIETSMSGDSVRAGDKDFFDAADPAYAALYREALSKLLKRGMVERKGATHFVLSATGFSAARTLKSVPDSI